MKNIDQLAYWIKEREKVRILKEKGVAKPWSKDWVFQTVYFCNVHREDDKVTKWIREEWESVHHEKYEFAMCLARLLNWPASLEAIGPPWKNGWSVGTAIDTLNARAEEGHKIWGNAYVVTTHGQKISKLEYLENVLTRLWEAPLHNDMQNIGKLSMAHVYLMQYEGFASFMAAQVIADLKNSEGHPLQYASDWWNWSAPGPGSLRGLAWVWHGPHSKVSPLQYNDMMKELHPAIEELVHPIHMCEQDLQNCLCEFDKYMRVKHRTGRSKRRYNGGKG